MYIHMFCVSILMGLQHGVMVLSPRAMPHLAKTTVPGLRKNPFELLVRRIQVSLTI